MAIPNTQNASQHKGSGGTIASRYLQAIGIQCGADTHINNRNNGYRSRPITKSNGSGFDNQYYSFRDSPGMKKSKKKGASPMSIYDKLSNTTKAADCSKSIITASTALMLDHSFSPPNSPGGSGHSKGKSPSRARIQRRGRSPTAFRGGTNSKGRTTFFDDSQHEHGHLPGSHSTAPLSDGVKSAPSTPSRLNERRKLDFRTQSWGNRSANTAFSGGSSEGESNHSPLYDSKTTNYDDPSTVSSQSSHNARRNLFPKTNPQSTSERQYTQQQQGETYSTSLFQQIPKTPDRYQQHENGAPYNNNLHPHYPTESEAGSPTEIIENRWHPADESSQPSSSHYYSDPTDSEAGAPTEITKNHTPRRKLSKDNRNNNTNDILSRVRSRFHNQQKQQKQQQPSKEDIHPNNANMPSLLDSASSCASSTQPMPAEGTPASTLPNTRLSRHVENARKKSILSPSPSDATSLPASVENETFGSTTAEMGSVTENNQLAANPLLAKPSATETAPKQGSLMRRPVGARVAALESQYRKGKFTARGARLGSVTNQDTSSQEEEASEDEKVLDPILSPSYSLDDSIQDQCKQSEEARPNGVENIEMKVSEEDFARKSYGGQQQQIYDEDVEESPLPGYIRDQGDGNLFVAYNDRQTPNTDGVFQLKSKGKRKTAQNKKKREDAADNAISNNRERERGKSPIQPLFSSERLDENNTSSIHESSVRSKSLGRSVTSNEVKKIENKRSKSLSERSERKHQTNQMSSMELSQAMKAIARERKRRNQMKQKEETPEQSVPGNIVINNEELNIQGGADASLSGSSLTQSSIRSPPSQPSRALGEKRFLPSPGEATAKAPRNQQVSANDASSSIKDKIRAFNLKKSPKNLSPSWKFEKPRDLTKRSKVDEEKKEDENTASRFNENRNNLERKSLWARYYAESLNNHDEDESNSNDDDDLSVSSLREQLEHRIAKSQNDGEVEDDDDDRSVKSLRDMFEPATKKQTGDAVNQLKARFEPKPKAPRLAFTKQARLQRERNKPVDKSKSNAGALQKSTVASDPPESSYQEKSRTEPRSNDSYGRLNNWSTREGEKNPIRKQPVEQSSRTTNDTRARANMDVASGNGRAPSKSQVFGVIEKRQAPLRDNNRKVPGYQWVMKGDSSDGGNSIQKKDTKDSSDSSEAVTLDPSFAEVSNLSNPSALQSLSPEQEDFGESSSVLFENLDSNLSGELGASNSGLAIPELKESRREVNNARVVSGSTLRNYRNLNTHNMTQHQNSTEMEISHKDIKEEHPQIVTPDSGYSSGSHFFKRTGHDDPNDRFQNSQRIVSPLHEERRHPAHVPSPGLKALNASRRPMFSSDRMAASKEQVDLAKGSPYQNSKTSYLPAENSHWGFDGSNRSSRSSEGPSSYRSARSTDSSNRSRGLQESPGELSQSVVIPRREGEFSDRSTRSSGLSSFHDNSSPSFHQKPTNIDSALQEDYYPSRNEKRDQKTIHKHSILAGPSLQSQNPSNSPSVPPIPSPFDADYAAIMESRHKMLLVRQRALLNRRANREKAQKYQQGFFGRTNPGKTDDSTSLLSSTYREPRLSDELKDDWEKRYPEIRRASKPSNPSSGWESPPTSYDSQRGKETHEAGQVKSPVASMLSKIRPTFNAISRKDNGASQTQAVIDRISAVRAARLRRNYAYGKVIQDSNILSASGANRKESGLPKKLGALHKNALGYRYYPHTEMDDSRPRDGDESLSTFESNPQDYAAGFALD